MRRSASREGDATKLQLPLFPLYSSLRDIAVPSSTSILLCRTQGGKPKNLIPFFPSPSHSYKQLRRRILPPTVPHPRQKVPYLVCVCGDIRREGDGGLGAEKLERGVDDD